MKINYQSILEEELKKIEREEGVPSLLLHSCCAPCSSYVMEYLSNYFNITIYFYNPNITFEEEYRKRAVEQQEFIDRMNPKHPIKYIEGRYETEEFYNKIKGYEKIREGGKRCFRCYELRLEEAAIKAKDLGFDYFCTALSISPMKNARKINEIGADLEEKYGVKFLHSDFKKKNGYKRSTEISKEQNLYRQDYCGCAFSKAEREEHARMKAQERDNEEIK
ncbi:hypothetical protein PM10SUCC1_03330 [Propionigenium maris DSM 9537]|uniref:Epoxyqueuosine reductase QueH n=1 Tax=Propionigenium maris DSM 9537 TaxID=1123000 RepID=A0A9W6GGH1_9FUSO|nr:epoxyqueuosine reductase QueH [Propionigenium maris]GLI54818.1 hypothetical protein PM10SUCC1_03330 [Propionigenium maris DSM 9537]